MQITSGDDGEKSEYIKEDLTRCIKDIGLGITHLDINDEEDKDRIDMCC
jgi:hypothetical protein